MPEKENIILDYARLTGQRQYTRLIREHLAQKYETPPLALVHSFGCQQNAADGERIKGILGEMGYGFTESPEEADLIFYNTCAVRENAEKRVLGTVGAMKHYKRQKPGLVIAMAGCMTQQQSVADKIKKSYPHVDIVLGADAWALLPERLYAALCLGKRSIKAPGEEPDTILENLPARRTGFPKAWVTVMYGCNNFCSYCIVPYVRGRERSRRPEDILREVESLIGEGYRDITLLGQNVNSYAGGISFPELLRRIDDLPGEFCIRFMTSHPKDCTRELLDAMADCEKVAKHLHLPVQSGSGRGCRTFPSPATSSWGSPGRPGRTSTGPWPWSGRWATRPSTPSSTPGGAGQRRKPFPTPFRRRKNPGGSGSFWRSRGKSGQNTWSARWAKPSGCWRRVPAGERGS